MTGHWGEDAVGFRWTEQDSVDNRFQQMDTGQFFSGSIVLPAATIRPTTHTHKAICIRIGERNEAAICFDTELLRVVAGWTGPFLQMDGARYGLIVPPKVAGEVTFSSPAMPGWSHQGKFEDRRSNKPYGPLPREHARYGGLYLHGNRVVLKYTVGDTQVLDSPWFETLDGIPIVTRLMEIGPSDQELEVLVCGRDGVAAIMNSAEFETVCKLQEVAVTTVKIAPRRTVLRLMIAIAPRNKVSNIRLGEILKTAPRPSSLESLQQPSGTRWNERIETRGERAPTAGPFAIDNLQLPFDNPYRALMFVSGHDFFANGDAAICTAHGDVWRVSGLTDGLERLTWKRFATGLFQPLGLKIVDEKVCVVGRDQITRLHDRNADGEADYYENVNNEGQVTLNGHEYVTCLETDSHGNFYYLKGDSGSRTQHDGCLLRVSPDGQKLEVFATGLRNANGLGIGPRDEISVAPQEGEWTPASGIFFVKQGGFCGAMQIHHRPQPPTDFDRPICWLPRRVDNSSGGQVWVPEGKWGPLGGQLLHLSYGQCTMLLVLRESLENNAQVQGGAVTLPGKFASGVMRGRFHPIDGNLYVSGLRGWVTNATADGCFQRVRYTGQPLATPVQMRTYANGIALTFSEPLDRDRAEDPDSYRLEQWNYRWSAEYGSPELKPSQLGVEGRESVYVESASLLPDQRTVFLEIASLAPVWQLAIQCRVAPAGSEHQTRALYCTLHKIPTQTMDMNGLSRRRSHSHLTEDQRRQLAPGLIVRLEQDSESGKLQDVVRRRMAALHVNADEAATGQFRPGPFRAVFEGYLRANEPGQYQLRLTGIGTAGLFLNDQLIQDASDVSQSFDSDRKSPRHELLGYARVRIEYEQKLPGKDAEVQLLWRSESGVEEPVPPTAWWSSTADPALVSADQRREGHHAFQRLRCANCHSDSVDKAIATNEGPGLTNIGTLYHREWLVRWLLNPQSLRNDASMPRLLPNSATPMARQQAADLVAFLFQDNPQAVTKQTVAEDQSPLKEGERLWEELGCIGCHRMTRPEVKDDSNRISLHFVGLKYRHESLIDFLRRPHARYPAIRMPDFHLSSEEASALGVYLRSNSARRWDDGLDIPGGDAVGGRALAVQLRCTHCHDFGEKLARRESLRPVKRLTANSRSTNGCLSDAATSGASPHFPISNPTRAAIRTAMLDPQLDFQFIAAEQAQRLFVELRCQVCHLRDGVSSRLPELVAEEGVLGRPSESLPDLTWAGERFKSSWLTEFVSGQRIDRIRPQLKARMPAFPAYADQLARGFAAQHAVPLDASAANVLNATSGSDAAGSDAAVGYRLTLKDGGLDCRQCHGIGHQQPVVDERTRIAPGIDFVQVRDRLRYDFYRRFVLDPPRYEVNTKMPKLSADGKTTTVTHILDGNAPQQFDAIWSYIQTLRGDEP